MSTYNVHESIEKAPLTAPLYMDMNQNALYKEQSDFEDHGGAAAAMASRATRGRLEAGVARNQSDSDDGVVNESEWDTQSSKRERRRARHAQKKQRKEPPRPEGGDISEAALMGCRSLSADLLQDSYEDISARPTRIHIHSHNK